MMEFKLIAVFLTVSLLNTANALECYECFDVAKCRGEQKDHVVQCSNNTAQNMVLAAGFFYPNLTGALVYNGKYQCTALQFTPQGAQNVSLMAKGCMFETKESLCKLEAKIPNGNFSCKACNTNKCNSGVALGWSMLLMAASLIVSSWVAK